MSSMRSSFEGGRLHGYIGGKPHTGPGAGSCRLEVLADEPEDDAVDPLVVTPVRLSLDALLDEPRSLEMADGAVVEPVALELHTMEVEVENQVARHEFGRLRGEAASPEVGMEHDSVELSDAAPPVAGREGHRACRPRAAVPLDLDHKAPVDVRLGLRQLDLLE